MPAARKPAARTPGEKEAGPTNGANSGRLIDFSAPWEASFTGGRESASDRKG